MWESYILTFHVLLKENSREDGTMIAVCNFIEIT